jgi:hypothetical protein
MYWLVLDSEGQRTLEYVESQRMRRRQDPLRNELMRRDGRCALTGETTREALQAAHVIEVKDHDRRCFEITPDGRGAIAADAELSNYYGELLAGARLDPKVGKQVRRALERRMALNDDR